MEIKINKEIKEYNEIMSFGLVRQSDLSSIAKCFFAISHHCQMNKNK